MGMNMEDSLPGIRVGVEHNPIPTLKDALDLGNLPGGKSNISKQLRIGGSKLPQVPVPLPRHNQNMNPSLRPNIPEGKGGLILIDDIGRDLPTNDPFKESLSIQTAHKSTLPTHTTKDVPEGLNTRA
jgi:hypothetical protein